MYDQNTLNETDISQTNITTKHEVIKSRKRTSFEEFCIVNHLRPEIVAGFKIWLKGNFFHFDDEWDKLLYQYKNRTLKRRHN